MFPKPKAREKKKRKRMNAVRPEGRRSYSADQRARRKAEDTLYRRFRRPTYLMGLSRRQGRLVRREEDIPGEFPNQKLHALRPDELPLCEAGIEEAGCFGELPALHVHHKRGRGPHLNDPDTYLGVCVRCHDYIENNRRWAKEQGYLETRHKHVQESGSEGERA
jgi:hypothetical protein